MKEFIIRPLVFLTIIVILTGGLQNKTQASKYDSIWRETEFYPVDASPPDWDNYDLDGYIGILNPPKDLRQSFSTKKLAELMIEYPMLWTIRSYSFEQIAICFEYFERNCDVFTELIRRDGGIQALLEKYRDSGFSAKACNEYDCPILEFDQTIDAEAFMCQFINYYYDYFSDDEKQLAEEIIEAKSTIYSDIEDSFSKIYFEFERHDFESFALSDDYIETGVESSNVIQKETISSEPVTDTSYDMNVAPITKATEEQRNGHTVMFIVLASIACVVALGILVVAQVKSKKS